MYLTGARELRDGVAPPRAQAASLDLIRSTSTPELLDLLSVRLDPAKAKDGEVSVDLVFPDRNERYRVRVKHDVLTWEADPQGAADGTFTLPRAQFLLVALAGGDASKVKGEGDTGALARLLSWMTPPRPGFPIVTR
jgi:alkyl sulfatase BDS1-like metallo-beta-lactamase superfamily hydrolase